MPEIKSRYPPKTANGGDTWTNVTGEQFVWSGGRWISAATAPNLMTAAGQRQAYQGMQEEFAGRPTTPTSTWTGQPLQPIDPMALSAISGPLVELGLDPDIAMGLASSTAQADWVKSRAPAILKQMKDSGLDIDSLKWIVDPTTGEPTHSGESDLEAIERLLYRQLSREAAPEEVPDLVADPFGEGATGAGVGAAVVPPIFSPEEERTLVDLQNLMKIGEIDEDQAWKILENYWAEEAVRLGRAQEATARGTQELGYWQDIYRSVGPTPTLPRPEGLGFGVPPLQGIPVSQLPQPGEIFGQAQQQMGLPGQLPAIQAPDLGLPNWRALLENMPTFGPTGNTYIDELLREGRSTAPAL